MKMILNKIIEMFTGKCRFRNECKGYTKTSITCNKEASSYCGIYREMQRHN